MPFSTPFTFCSIGVATDASTSVAEAPTKVVVIWTIGGTTSGYWAIGQAGHRHEAEDDGDDGDHHRHDRSVDEEAGHAYFAFPASVAGSAVPLPPRLRRHGLRAHDRRPRAPSAGPRPRPSRPASGLPRSPTARPRAGPTLTLRNSTLLSAPDHGDAVEVLQLRRPRAGARGGRPSSSRTRSGRGRTARAGRAARGSGT